jgi:hypothetical protein
MPLPIGFQGIGDSWGKKKSAFVANRLPAQWVFSSIGWWVALAIVAIVEGKLAEI